MSWHLGRATWYQLESGDRNQGKISHCHQNFHLHTDILNGKATSVDHSWSRPPWPPDTLLALSSPKLFSLFQTPVTYTCYLTDSSTPMMLLCTTSFPSTRPSPSCSCESAEHQTVKPLLALAQPNSQGYCKAGLAFPDLE